MKRVYRQILLIVILSIILVEILLGTFAPTPDPYSEHKNKYLNNFISYEHDLSDKIDFKWEAIKVPKNDEEYRIFVVGNHIYTKELEDKLNRYTGLKKKFRIYNTGLSGERSDHHLSLLVHRLIHLQPDLIILRPPNDKKIDYTHLSNQTRLPFFTLFKFAMMQLQIPRQIYYALRDFNLVNTRPNSDSNTKETALALNGYRVNLRSVIGVTKSSEISLVFFINKEILPKSHQEQVSSLSQQFDIPIFNKANEDLEKFVLEMAIEGESNPEDKRELIWNKRFVF